MEGNNAPSSLGQLYFQGEALEGSCTRSPRASPGPRNIPSDNVSEELERQTNAETGKQKAEENGRQQPRSKEV